MELKLKLKKELAPRVVDGLKSDMFQQDLHGIQLLTDLQDLMFMETLRT